MVRFLPLAVLLLVASACAQGSGPRTGRGDAGTVTRPDSGGGCPSVFTDCGGACVDTASSAEHCGGCGIRCAAGEVCNAGMCESSCGIGLEACGGSCVDLSTSTDHCGACENACAAGELCMGGSCASSCPAGLTDCAGACRDLESDRSNCGACGRTCGAGEICEAGTCELSCPPGQTACGASCRDLATDEMHCGTCGHACAAAELCSGGACALVCGGGLTDCGGTCVDTASNTSHCGTCGHACAGGEICTSGACVPMVIPPETYAFPLAGDTRVAAGGAYFWRLGDYVEGTRTTGLATIDQIDVHLVVDPNVLSCDTQDVAVKINGITVGSFSITSGTTAVDRTYSFAAIAGPTYVVRYETTRQVGSGCGSAGYADGSGSSFTLHAP